MNPDRFGGRINDHLGKVKKIETPEQAFKLMEGAVKKPPPIVAFRMQQDEWRDWKALHDNGANVVGHVFFSTR